MTHRERCPNDNHGRMVIRVRCCPTCGDVLNAKIAASSCRQDSHAKKRRDRNHFCMDCGTSLA